MVIPTDSKAYRETAKVHKALSNERRMLLLSFLASQERPESFSVVDLAKRFKISYKLASRHLQILDQSELVERVRHGQSIGYQVTSRARDMLSVKI